jgi:serine/threonine protein phosphatase 1
MNWKTDQPMKAANIWNLDTGGGWGGRVTLMELATKQYWQSDPVRELYSDNRQF